MVVSWLVHSVSPSIRDSIIWMDQAFDIWNDLKNRFAQGDLARISNLQMDAANLSQGDLSVTDFFTKLRVLWDEIDSFRSDPTCTCKPQCSCTVSSLLSQRKREDRAMQLLRGLNDNFSNIKSHVLLLDPIPPISKIFSLVVQQERQFMAGHVAAQIRGNYVPIPSSSSDNSHTPIACTHCHRPGHTENTCFRKHGFPNQDPRSVKPNNNNSRKVCTHCNRNGHTIDVCYKKHGYPPGHRLYSTKPSQINNAATQSDTNLDSHPSPTETITLTPQQYQILADLFKQSNMKSPNVQINQVGSISTNPSPPGNIVSAIQVHSNHL